MLQSKSKWNFMGETEEITNFQLAKHSPLIKELLLQRGITTQEEAEAFLSPDIKNLHNPRDFSTIDKATERVHKAISNHEKILVFGDYDADGVCSTAVLLGALQELGADCDFYIPNRFSEGYGPNEAAFKTAYNNGYTVIITVDTGIAAIHEATVAKQLGIDLIITDHHEVQEQLPPAYAIIHPKCSPSYEFKELAGVGVAFKFAENLLGYFPKQFLDIAAVGTIADLVPLKSENRILAYHGLKAITVSQRPGLVALKKVCNITANVTEEDVGFQIAPRINAVGRLQDADLAVELLLADNLEQAEEIAVYIQSINEQRQQIVNDIFTEAHDMIEQNEKPGVIVVAKEGWNQGVLGIVASKLVRKYDRPAIVLSILPEGNIAKGSARSIPAFDLFENCMHVRDLFTNFGGHAQAAGMTLPLENVDLLQVQLDKLIHEQLTSEDFAQQIDISKTVCIPEINEELIDEMNQLAPFGMANPKPVFHLKHIPNEIRQIGNMKKHLKMQFKQDSKVLDGIGFGMGILYNHVTPQTPIEVVGELGINEWNGYKKVQIVIQDAKIEEKQVFDHRGKKECNTDVYHQTSNQRSVAVYNSLPGDNQLIPSNAACVTYDTDISLLEPFDTLYLYGMPPDLKHLEQFVRQINPSNIHVCFQLEDSAFMKSLPARDDFKWLYALFYKRKKVNLHKELNMIMDGKGWTKDKVTFMVKVFFELGFVKIENGIVEVNTNPVKKDLTEAEVYQKRLKQAEIEKTLYYSTYETLKSWFLNCLQLKEPLKEEKVDGLQKIY